jgi:hypothetical protein
LHISDKNTEKRQHSFYLNEQLYDSFKKMAKLLLKGSVSEALEEAMTEWIKAHKDETRVSVELKIVEPKQAVADLATRLDVKMIKEKLEGIIAKLEKIVAGEIRADSEFWKERLQQALKKAIPLQKKTKDPELEQLFARAEKLL